MAHDEPALCEWNLTCTHTLVELHCKQKPTPHTLDKKGELLLPAPDSPPTLAHPAPKEEKKKIITTKVDINVRQN